MFKSIMGLINLKSTKSILFFEDTNFFLKINDIYRVEYKIFILKSKKV